MTTATPPPAAAETIEVPQAAARASFILAQRARALARPIHTEEAEASLVPLLLFELGGVAHAVEARFVREVLRRPPLSGVPMAPPALIGVANVRGEIVVVADVSLILGLGRPEVPGPVIVLEGAGPSLGLLVDAVHDFVEVPSGSIAPRPQHDRRTDSSGESLLLGVTPEASVLSGTALLSDPRFSTTTTTTSPITTEPRSGR